MNAKVAAVGIFLIVGTVTRMIVFMKEADRQLWDAGGEAWHSADLP